MKLRIREELLHYIWQLQAYDQIDLVSTDGAKVEVLNPGILNHNAGPDFINAKIKIGRTLWAGHVEIHLKSSDWHRHKHGVDPQYQNVVLHVVYHADQEIKLKDNTLIPCLALESRIHPSLLRRYEVLLSERQWIPCEKHISQVSEIIITSTIHSRLADRLEEKATFLLAELENLKGDLSTLIYRRLAWSLGLSVNADAMKVLMSSISPNVIQKHRDNLFQLEALLFGQSGLLDDLKDEEEYIVSLKREYAILKVKFGLNSISPTHWKYLRLRPAAFPTIRIAQFAKLLNQVDRLDDLLLNGSEKEIHDALEVKADGYWKYHYTWGSPSIPRSKSLGKNKRQSILINTVAPILWMYGTYRNNRDYNERAITLLESSPREKNSIIDQWEKIGITSNNAADTQGLLQLKKTKCAQQRCLQCPIGHAIMSGKNNI